jgi:hypothetical protein
MWILVAYNLDTKQLYYWLEGDTSWKEAFSDATLMIGHNIMAFDNIVLKKLFDFEFPNTCNFVDTLILSRVLNYRRFGDEGHTLERWGVHFNYPKKHHEDWSQYSEAMKERCIQDVRLNIKVYNQVIKEYKKLKEKNPQIKNYILAEHAVAKWCGLASLYGWPFDLEAAKKLIKELEQEMNTVTAALESQLGYKIIPLDKEDGVVVPKKMKYNKDGTYNSRMASFFGIDPIEGLLEDYEKTIVFGGEFCRIKIEPLKLSSSSDVKLFLSRNGWKPTEWNYKKDKDGKPVYEKGKRVKTSPKITEDSLELLGGKGKLYPDYLTARSRYSILKTWIDETSEAGTLHGDCITIGTPSMRARHSIIVNVPSAESPWGKEMRSLFISKPGWTLVGCDSEGNQARGLAHYLEDSTFIDTLLNGDIHTYNSEKIEEVLTEMGIKWEPEVEFKEEEFNNFVKEQLSQISTNVTEFEELAEATKKDLKALFIKKLQKKAKRAVAKRILYAFLFGAAGPKLWSYIFGSLDDTQGPIFKNGFTKAVPGFKSLLDKLAKIYSSTSAYESVDCGYIYSIAGNRIYVDSFHKLLVYLLQSCEKITCATACMLLMEWLEAEGIPYQPCIMMHDELDFLVPDEYAERAAELGKLAFAEGPKLYGITIMSGSSKLGKNWFDVH